MSIDQLSDEFIAAYAEWLGVTEGEAYQLLKEEPLVEVADEEVQAAGWDESEHPRHPKGHPDGGQFSSKEGGEEELGSARDPGWEGDPLEPKPTLFSGLFGGGTPTQYDSIENSEVVWGARENPDMQYTLDYNYYRETIDRDYYEREEPLLLDSPEWAEQLATYQANVEEMMRQVGEEGELRITTGDGTALTGIVVDGRFKSQFETGVSGGVFSPNVRAAQEEMFFGYPLDMPFENRPIYGWLEHPDADYHRQRLTSQYGTVTWHIKPEVKSRTTVSFVDSLSRPIVPGPIRNPGYRSTVPPGYEDHGLGSMVSDHEYETGLFDGDAIETQYHGGLTLDDVSEVDITVYGGWSVPEVRSINEAAIEELERRGIQVRFVDEYGDELGPEDTVP